MPLLPQIELPRSAVKRIAGIKKPKPKKKRTKEEIKAQFKRYSYYDDEYYSDVKAKQKKFSYDDHVWLQKPLRYQYPVLCKVLQQECEEYGTRPTNKYLDVGLTGTGRFWVMRGDSLKLARFDPFFNRYGTWNKEDGILHLHMGYMDTCPDVREEYQARTMHQYLKHSQPLVLFDGEDFYNIWDFRHEHQYPLTHIIHCYTAEIPRCWLKEHWEKCGRELRPLKHYIDHDKCFRPDWLSLLVGPE